MDFLIDPKFWAFVIGVYLLLQLEPPFRATLWFGLINGGVLLFLLGLPTGLSLYALAALLWLGIRYAVRLQLRRVVFVIAAGVFFAGLFVLHKLNLQHSPLVEYVQRLAPGSAVFVLSTLLAVSFSYVALRLVDMVRLVMYEGTSLLDPISMVGYLVPFHMLVSGPICPYKEHLLLDARKKTWPTFSHLLRAVSVITTGLFYKLVIAECMRIYAYGLEGPMTVETWAQSAYFLVYLYFDFAGYSLVALGIGRLCGVPTPRNFYAPLLASTVTDFWTRWHASLGSFVRRNIFTPLQLTLMRRTRGRGNAAIGLFTLIVSFLFVALWHHLGWSVLLWGLAMGVLMAMEKTARDYFLRRRWAHWRSVRWGYRIVGPVYVFAVISGGLLLIAREML